MSIPKEPRQLMINLMYLVLTAMLALNVSAKIINAFFVIDRGIKSSNSIIDESNAFASQALEKAIEQDPEKYRPLLDAAKQVQSISKDFNSFVESIRDTLVESTGGYYPEDDKHHPGLPKGYKNKDVTTRILVNQGKGELLKDRVLNTHKQVMDIVTRLKGIEGTEINDQTLADLEKSISLTISNDWEKDRVAKSWSEFTFKQMPLASVFPLLTKFQNDMKSSEAAVINYLAKNVGAESFKVDNFIPISSARKSYVIAGEPYEAEISVGATSKSITQNVEIRVNGAALKAEDGVAKYSASTGGSTGIKKYKVDVTLTNPSTGKRETYSKEFEYEVGRRSVTVSADKMNVFYKGVENPISVVAAGVSSNELRVSGSNVTLRGSGGKYTADVTSSNGVAKITVSGGGLSASTFEFRIKPIPDPVAQK
ncbi:MAG: hypothetical protein H6555_07735 [Lewinellaceae bacterium]|nr:hypothetical protein [Lewinellaceae bacterium]